MLFSLSNGFESRASHVLPVIGGVKMRVPPLRAGSISVERCGPLTPFEGGLRRQCSLFIYPTSNNTPLGGH